MQVIFLPFSFCLLLGLANQISSKSGRQLDINSSEKVFKIIPQCNISDYYSVSYIPFGKSSQLCN